MEAGRRSYQKMAYTHARWVLSTNLGLFVDLFVHRLAFFFFFFKVVLLPRSADGQSSRQSVVVSPCTEAWPISQGGAAVAAWPKTLCPQPWVVMMSVRTSPLWCTCTAFSALVWGTLKTVREHRTSPLQYWTHRTSPLQYWTHRTSPLHYCTLPSLGMRGQ